MDWFSVGVGAFAAVIVGLGLAYVGRLRVGVPLQPVDDGAAMPPAYRRVLAFYLLGLGVFLLYVIVKLWIVEFPDSPLVLDQQTTATAAAGAATPTPRDAGGPVLLNVFSQASPPPGSAMELVLYGSNFDKNTATVRLDRQPRTPTFRDDHLIVFELTAAALSGPSTQIVEVVNGDGKYSNPLPVTLARPRVPLGLLRLQFPITREVQLILLVLCAGALGSFLHALKSLGDFIGNRTLTASWYWWYIMRPFLGMAMAFVFYAVLRGGFLTGTPADVRVVNPFGAVAVAALVGMFSDKAAQKLAEIFDTLFKSEDTRTGKLAAPSIDKIEPATVRIGTPMDVKIAGDRLGKVANVRINGQDRKPKAVSDNQVTVALQPDDVKTVGQLSLSVVTADGTASAAVTVHVTDITIAVTPLPHGKAATPYSDKVAATGGTTALQFSLESGPPWLTIDPDGTLKGTPPAAGTAKMVVRVCDAAGACVSQAFDLTIDP